MILKEFQRKAQFLKAHAELITQNQLDWLIRNSESNGLIQAKALVKVSNRWYIHVENFTNWFASHAA